MPIITVNLVVGKSDAQKKAFIREISDAAVRTLGAPIDTVRVMIFEMSPDHFAVGGVTRAEKMKKGTKNNE